MSKKMQNNRPVRCAGQWKSPVFNLKKKCKQIVIPCRHIIRSVILALCTISTCFFMSLLAIFVIFSCLNHPLYPVQGSRIRFRFIPPELLLLLTNPSKNPAQLWFGHHYDCWWFISLEWRHDERDGVSVPRRLDCLLNHLFRRRSKKTSKLRITGLCEGTSPVTGKFPAQRASNAEYVSIWWRHHVILLGDIASAGTLTHWGRVTHICLSKLAIIGSDYGLAPGRRQTIIWTNYGILLIGPLGTNFSEILVGIQTFSFKKMHLKMSSTKWRPFCLGLNVLLGPVLIMCETGHKALITDNQTCWVWYHD